jgi:hypothetical protein
MAGQGAAWPGGAWCGSARRGRAGRGVARLGWARRGKVFDLVKGGLSVHPAPIRGREKSGVVRWATRGFDNPQP